MTDVAVTPISIRPAVPADYDAYVRLFAELGVEDPIPSAERFAETIAPRMRVAEAGGDVVGYVTTRAYGPLLHVMHLAVDRAARGQRIGQRLLEHVRDEARADGATHWYLNVKRDNAPALRLYERVGLRFELESFVMRVEWSQLPRVEVRDELAVADEDAAIAARFGVPIERLATFRARGNFRLVTSRDAGGEIDGFAAFDPEFPGCAVFCAARPELAAAMLETVRRHADPRFGFVRVTVEGDRALAEAILALGAQMTFEILRMSAGL